MFRLSTSAIITWASVHKAFSATHRVISYFVDFYPVLLHLVLHYSFMFDPIKWIIHKNNLTQSLILLFRFSEKSVIKIL